jgi:formate-dependent nitrite reductase membrane component NrfD
MNAKTARQWMVTHEWMVKPMAQTEWIDGQGIMVWLAEVFSALGSGLFLVSLFLHSWWGALFGWLMILLFKFPLHLFYLGKPARFWRAFPPFSKAWRTSWFARGVIFTALFIGFGTIQLVTSYLLHYHVISGSAASAVNVVDWVMMILAGIFIVLTGVYAGFAMSYCKSVPFWNTGLLPIVFLIMGIADGLALVTAVGLVTGGIDATAVESASRIALIANSLLILTYLINSRYQSTTAELSVKELVVGRLAAVFWGGIVLLGIAVPFVISIVSLFAGEASLPILVVAIICHTIGAFSLKYGVLKVGIYRPLLPKTSAF